MDAVASSQEIDLEAGVTYGMKGFVWWHGVAGNGGSGMEGKARKKALKRS